ncbi:lasso peptide biosynthesis PqqD family chaperone [Streptomyces sp. NPDC046261]|uniref:lasso peptide biosynthesis PqqD family chaperone n=1 Tax=Streptomyces sp. NPDC046261 TaxID=3157200 RepID=UPI0033DFE152
MSFALRADVTATETEHGTVLLDQRRGRYYQLNPTGALALRALLDGAGTEGAARALCETYGIPAQRAEADVAALLESLRGRRLAARR